MSQRITDPNDIDAITQQIKRISEIDGWLNYGSGEVSVQAAFVLPSGNLFRIGITDGDVAVAFDEEEMDEPPTDGGVLWVDARYRGSAA